MSSNNSKTKSNRMVSIVLIGLAVFLILFFIYSTYKGYSNYKKVSPYLIDGIMDGTVAKKISASKILPPSDSNFGTEFTYSFWILIKDTNFTSTNSTCGADSPFLHIFHKGSNDYVPNNGKTNGKINYPLLQMPGVWLYPNTNKLHIRFNTYENIIETSDIGNIPLNMWVNVTIVLIGSSIDVYVNGNLKKRTKLSGVPKINYGDFYTSNWGGFQGYLSKLRYFNYAIQPFLIDQIFNKGPSQQFETNITQGIFNPTVQLSQNYWMTSGYPNGTISKMV